MNATDTLALDCVKETCVLATSAQYYLNNTLIQLMSRHQYMSHRDLAEELTEALMYHNRCAKNNKIKKLTASSRKCADKQYDFHKVVNEVGNVLRKNCKKISGKYPIDISYYPIISSGRGIYSAEFDVGSNSNAMQFRALGSIVYTFSVGVQYNGYCSNVTRTMMIHPPESMRRNYAILPQIQELILKELKPGVALSDVYFTAIQFVNEKRPDLLKYLVKNFGNAIGINWKENLFSINSDTPARAQEKNDF